MNMDRFRTILDTRVFARECEDPILAEVVLLRALEHSEAVFGTMSSITGSILLDLIDFYEQQQRHAECEPLYQRVHSVLAASFFEMCADD